jgi:uncharacterized protein YndB with AHSA1/START domain
VRPFTVHAVISVPRERVFDELADLSRRVAWTDHYMREYRLARANPVGAGAAARFQIRAPAGRQWVEVQIAECDRPRRLVERGRYGRVGRSRIEAVWELVAQSAADTRVELTVWTEPAGSDALKEAIGGRGWLRRQVKGQLERLRMALEEPPAEPLARVTVAGWEPAKHARFGA